MMSSANFVCPVHFARASTLRKGLPTTFNGLPLFCITVRAGLSLTVFWARAGTSPAPTISLDSKQTLARQFHLLTAHLCRRQLHRFVNFDIAGTAAQIS